MFVKTDVCPVFDWSNTQPKIMIHYVCPAAVRMSIWLWSDIYLLWVSRHTFRYLNTMRYVQDRDKHDFFQSFIGFSLMGWCKPYLLQLVSGSYSPMAVEGFTSTSGRSHGQKEWRAPCSASISIPRTGSVTETRSVSGCSRSPMIDTGIHVHRSYTQV